MLECWCAFRDIKPDGVPRMKHLIIVTLLLLGACDRPSEPIAKIAVPQREALDKAKAVEQMIQDNADATRQKIEEAAK